MFAALLYPVFIVQFVLVYLGNPIGALFWTPHWVGGERPPVDWLQYLPGALALALFALLLRRLFDRNPSEASWWRTAPWITLALFSLAVGLMFPLGRRGILLDEALNSRYITFSSLFWCALVCLAAQQAPLAWRGRLSWSAALLVLLACIPLARINAPWEVHATTLRLEFEALRYGHLAPLYLRDLAFDPDQLRDLHLPTLTKHRLCGFTNTPPNPNRAHAYIRHARHLQAQGQTFRAKLLLETALRLDPQHKEAQALKTKP